jgi:hypothetical protein
VRIVVTLEDGTAGTDYLASLARAGFRPEEILVLRSADVPPASFDGLMLGGGEDVANCAALRRTAPDKALEHCNRAIASRLVWSREKARAPTAICRGIQIVNVACGGSLVRTFPGRVAGRPTSRRSPKTRSRTVTSSGVRFPAGTLGSSRGITRPFRIGAKRAPPRWTTGWIEAVEADSVAGVSGIRRTWRTTRCRTVSFSAGTPSRPGPARE